MKIQKFLLFLILECLSTVSFAGLPEGFKVKETNHDDNIVLEGSLHWYSGYPEKCDKFCAKCDVEVEFLVVKNEIGNDKDIRRAIVKDKFIGEECRYIGKNELLLFDRKISWGQKFLCNSDPISILSAKTANSGNLYFNAVSFKKCQIDKQLERKKSKEEILIFLHQRNYEEIFIEILNYWLDED